MNMKILHNQEIEAYKRDITLNQFIIDLIEEDFKKRDRKDTKNINADRTETPS